MHCYFTCYAVNTQVVNNLSGVIPRKWNSSELNCKADNFTECLKKPDPCDFLSTLPKQASQA